MRFCYQPDQCERTKNGGFSLRFCTKTEQSEREASMQQKRIITKAEQCERGLRHNKYEFPVIRIIIYEFGSPKVRDLSNDLPDICNTAIVDFQMFLKQKYLESNSDV